VPVVKAFAVTLVLATRRAVLIEDQPLAEPEKKEVTIAKLLYSKYFIFAKIFSP